MPIIPARCPWRDDIFPVNVIVTLNDGTEYEIRRVVESSITYETKKGTNLLVMEREGNGPIIYVPNVVYWSTSLV
jgi:hypothetical protein